jgi:diaminopimelate decarboxylase
MPQKATHPLRVFEALTPASLAQRIPTPFYAYSATAIRRSIQQLQAALSGLDTTICFAVKANPSLAILELMANAGLGADIVSAGELRRSLHAGIPARRTVFSGVGKTEEEIAAALAAGIWKFNVESSDELASLQRLARQRGTIAHAAVRINPDVDARTHAKISTGRRANKFGVGPAEARRWFAQAAALPNVRLDGLHVHIGSQLLHLDPLRVALRQIAALWRELAAAGHPIDTIDVGGGLGVRYRADDQPVSFEDYARVLSDALADFDGRIVLEPGRRLVAEAGVLVTRVVRLKAAEDRTFLVVDAAMNDLVRPSLYDAWHEIVPVHEDERQVARYDIVGPVCETGDTFAVDRELPACAAGDLLLIAGAGAYAAAMASGYNSRPLLAEVLIDGSRYALVRRRQTHEEMLACEQFPAAWCEP